jgi:hypothetical protein
MVSSKSQIDFYVGLLSELLFDDPLHICSARSIQRDVLTISSRASEEGLGFLTKTLPKLGKAIDQALGDTFFTIPSEFKTAKDVSIPAFMQAYFKNVFDRDGWLLENADPAAVEHLRQVCFMLYKLEVPYKPADEARVIESFKSTEAELKLADGFLASDELIGAAYIIRDALRGFDHKSIIPRHGPGAVSTGERLDEKWEFSRLYRCIHQVYPYYEYFVVGGSRELIDRLGWYKSLKRLEKGRAKVVLVPKDSRGPRLISAEPLEFQFIQQGLGRSLVSHLEAFPATRGQINFTNQEVNRQLALSSSKTGEYATLDLKDASDRVSLQLVRHLFQFTPELLAALEATRSAETQLPDKEVISLSKFAPMGSALCFPIEALCFWAICVSAVSRERHTRLRPAEVGKHIYVYGDDIIVKTAWAGVCMEALERYGLKVNRSKSFISGEFRESCGMDAFKGVQVTPTRLKTLWSGQRTDGAAYVSYVSFANQIGQRGYRNASDYVWKFLRRTYGPTPFGVATSSFPCRIVPREEEAMVLNHAIFKSRWRSDFQRVEFLVPKAKTRTEKSGLDGWNRLMREQLVPSTDRDPSINVLPRSLRIKWGWAAV